MAFLAGIAFDNFLMNSQITKTYSSEVKTMPGKHLEQMFPELPWQTTGKTAESVALACSTTGPRKPFFFAIGKHNFTKDAIIKLQASTLSSFSSIAAEDSITIGADNYDYSTPASAQPKIGRACATVLAASDANKAFVRLLIADTGNAASFLRMAQVFIGTVVDLAYHNINVGIVQGFSDPSESIFSIDHHAHVRPRRIRHRVGFAVTIDLLRERASLRKALRHVGTTLPVWIALNDTVDTEVENATQLYYGRFVSNGLVERRYVQGTEDTLIDARFEFEEII